MVKETRKRTRRSRIHKGGVYEPNGLFSGMGVGNMRRMGMGLGNMGMGYPQYMGGVPPMRMGPHNLWKKMAENSNRFEKLQANKFYRYYGSPQNLRNPVYVQAMEQALGGLLPGMNEGSSRTQTVRLNEHREQSAPALRNVSRKAKNFQKKRNARKEKNRAINELKYLPPIHEVGFPGGNEYRKAAERWEAEVTSA